MIHDRTDSSPLDSGRNMAIVMAKNLPANAEDRRDVGSIPGPGRSPGGGHGNPLQYSCLDNPMDSGADYTPWGRKELDTAERLNWTELRKLGNRRQSAKAESIFGERENRNTLLRQLCASFWQSGLGLPHCVTFRHAAK